VKADQWRPPAFGPGYVCLERPAGAKLERSVNIPIRAASLRLKPRSESEAQIAAWPT